MQNSKSQNNNSQRVQKSLQERFLFVIGILFFGVYLVLGILIIFWKQFPIKLDLQYRIAFGVLLVVYAFFRFVRLIKKNQEQ